MLVPFGAIPEHLLKPLHVDTALQYSLKKLKLPNLKDPAYSQSTLLLAPFQHQLQFVSDSPDCRFNQHAFKPSYEALEEDRLEWCLEEDAPVDTELDWGEPGRMLNPLKDKAMNNPLTSYNAFHTEQVKNGTPFQDGRRSNPNSQHCQAPISTDLTGASGDFLANLNEIYLGTPLQYGHPVEQIKDRGLEKCFLSHNTSDTNIPMFPMKEEDIDWFFSNPVTSPGSESSSDDVITYANLTKMGYIWETDYYLDCDNQDNYMESRV